MFNSGGETWVVGVGFWRLFVPEHVPSTAAFQTAKFLRVLGSGHAVGTNSTALRPGDPPGTMPLKSSLKSVYLESACMGALRSRWRTGALLWQAEHRQNAATAIPGTVWFVPDQRRNRIVCFFADQCLHGGTSPYRGGGARAHAPD